MKSFLVIAFLAVFLASAQALVIIQNDYGGRVDEYSEKYWRLAQSGQSVRIEGICDSACTLITGLVPRSRVCVGPYAALGFHAARLLGQSGISADGNAMLMRAYHPWIRLWVNRHNALGSLRVTYLSGPELRKFYKLCRA